MTKCHISFLGHCDLDRPSFKNYCVQSISLIFFEVEIPNLVCGFIFIWRSVMYHFWVTVTLTSDLVSRIIVSEHISRFFFELGIPNWVCLCILGWSSVTFHFRVTVTLTSDLVLIIIVSRAYLLYYLT